MRITDGKVAEDKHAQRKFSSIVDLINTEARNAFRIKLVSTSVTKFNNALITKGLEVK